MHTNGPASIWWTGVVASQVAIQLRKSRFQSGFQITGGQAAPGQQNIWVIHANAYTEVPPNTDFGAAVIPPGGITIQGQPLDANGNAYFALPNNAEVDITPMASVGAYDFPIPTVTAYQPVIQANGVTLSPTSVNATFCVGQQIVFTLTGLPPGIINAQCNWNLPAKFVNNWTQAMTTILDTNGEPIQVPTGSTNYFVDNTFLSYNTNGPISTKCWYVNGSGGTVSVGANLLLSNGRTVSIAALGQFAIYRPNVIPANPLGTQPYGTSFNNKLCSH